MATYNYLFTGMTKWAKVRKPDEKYDNYQVPLYLDDDSWELFEKSGCQLKVHEDADGKYVTFKRREAEYNQFKKETEVNGPPAVLIKKDDEYVPWPEGLIGNGSNVSVKVAIFDTRNGKGHRLLSVGINDLVEYDPENNSGGKDAVEMPF